MLNYYNVNSQKSKQIIVSGGDGLFGRRLSSFNNTMHNNISTNNYHNNYFQSFLSYIRNYKYCVNNKNLYVNQSVETVFQKWNNHTINTENSTFISAIASSLGITKGKLFLS